MPPRTRDRAEHRWPAVGAVVVGLVLYAALPSDFLPWVRIAVVAACALLLIPLVIVNPVRMQRQTRWSRGASLALAGLLVAANHLALVQLIVALVTADQDEDGSLLLTALQVWSAQVIGFALLYWELDRGGPVTRTRASRDRLPSADFRFPRDEDADAVAEVARESSERSDWTPAFADYAYLSMTNTMAFAPADAMPLTTRVKALTALQAFGGFVLALLVIARAVSLLG